MKTSFKRSLLGLAAAGLMSTQAIAEDITLKFASTLVEKSMATPMVLDMIKEIEDADVGISINYFPAGQLGSGEELLEDAKFGNVDMVQAAVYAQADQRLEFLFLPFMITTYDELDAAFNKPDSTFNDILGGILADHGLKHLASVGEGLIGVVASKTPANPTGIGDQEMALRVWSSQLVKSTMELLGYQATTMSWAEVVPAVQAGTIDGAICCTAEGAYAYFAASDIGNTYVPYNAFVELGIIYVNGGTWGKMTPEQQEVLQRVTTATSQKINAYAWEVAVDYTNKLRDKNWTVVEFTDEERARIKETVIAEVWPQMADLVGKDIIERLSE